MRLRSCTLRFLSPFLVAAWLLLVIGVVSVYGPSLASQALTHHTAA